MADTFTQIYIQVVFAVKGRNSLIHPTWEERLHQYIAGIVRCKKQKMIAINGTPDHIHFFIGMNPKCCLSDLIREVKKSSNEFVNENNLSKFKFSWQEGFGAFSYSHSHIDQLATYVLNQKTHHQTMTFKSEYLDFLRKFEIDYDVRYLFEWLD
ncbi:MAG: IS200/IS605 family transposase [Marinilabiliales bacterium]|nr:IS200/IS605 family transposase [Marinilabiliales bacterium]